MSPVPQLLLLTGAPASGKTRLAARLQRRYGACCCSKDEIKELLFDALGERDPRWSRQLSNASFALLFAYAPRLLSAQRLLLMEGNFRPGEHEPALQAVVSASAAGLAQILCRADAATCASRLAARATDPGRHPGHRDRDLDAAAARPAGFLELAGPRWVFNSDTPGDDEWLGLCRRIDSWRDTHGGHCAHKQ
jgi:predicted kinase